jgi:hypothetical protein
MSAVRAVALGRFRLRGAMPLQRVAASGGR